MCTMGLVHDKWHPACVACRCDSRKIAAARATPGHISIRGLLSPNKQGVQETSAGTIIYVLVKKPNIYIWVFY
jgi:hypothetical protein